MISVESGPEQDLLDQRELDDVHPDLGVDDGAQRVEDRELGRPPLGIEGELGRGRVGGGRSAVRVSVVVSVMRGLRCVHERTHQSVAPPSNVHDARGGGRDLAVLTTTPGTRYWAGRPAASASV